MNPRLRLAALAGLFLVAAFVLELPDESAPHRVPALPGLPSRRPSPRPPRLTAAQTNRQDHIPRSQRRRELRGGRTRPLLAVLPLELAGVRIAIAGIAADRRTTLLEITPGPRGRAYAQVLYRRALYVLGDPGRAYAIRWVQ